MKKKNNQNQIFLFNDFNINDDFDLDIKTINNKLLEQMMWLKTLSNREYLLVRKFYELKEYIKTVGIEYINRVKNKIISRDDIIKFVYRMINNRMDEIDLKILPCFDKYSMDEWNILKKFVSVLYWSQNPGRNLKFIIYINGKIIGFVSLGSDIMSISVRDNYIGWNKEQKIKNKKINHTQIASTIVQTQPFGYLFNGGKLISLLLYSKLFRDIWKEKYNNVLVGLTTTSLFGIKTSQYNGMKKYWRPLGETKGNIPLHPLENVYSLMREYLRKNYPDEYKKQNEKTGPKQNIISLYYKISGFNKLWKEKSGMLVKDLNLNFNRGVYFQKFYENTKEFLQNKINEDKLKPRENLDFDINNEKTILIYWWNKFGHKRYKKIMQSVKSLNELNWKPFFMDDIYYIDNVNDFIERFKKPSNVFDK